MILRQFVFFLLLSISFHVQAAVHVWTGSLSNRFSEAGNWIGGSPAGDAAAELSFPGGVARLDLENDLASLTVRSVSFSGGGYVLRGSRLTLTADAQIVTAPLTVNEIAGDIMLAGPVTIATASSGRLTLSGAISGSGPVVKRGEGQLVFAGANANTYSAATHVMHGELRLAKADDTDAVAGELFIDNTKFNYEYGSVTTENREQIRDTARVNVGEFATLYIGSVETVGPITLAAGAKINTSARSGSGNALRGRGVLAGDITVGRRAFGETELSGEFAFSGSRTITTCNDCASLRIAVAGEQPIGAGLILRGDEGSFGNSVGIRGTYRGPTLVEGANAAVDNPNTPVRLRGGRFSGNVYSLTSERGTVFATGGVTTKGDLRLNPLTDVELSFWLNQPKLTVGGALDLNRARLVFHLDHNLRRVGGMTYTIGLNKGSGAISNTFSSVPEGAVLYDTWRVSYAGGDGNDLTFHDLGRFRTNVTLDAPGEVRNGERVQLTARVHLDTNAPRPQQVTFSEGSTTLGTAPIANSAASITVEPPSHGKHVYTATIVATPELLPSSASRAVTVHPPAAVITSVEPSILQSGTRTEVAVRGSGLLPGGSVTVESTLYSNVQYVSANEVRFTWSGSYEEDQTMELRYTQPGTGSVASNALRVNVKGSPTPKTQLTFEPRAIVAPVIAGGGAAWLSVAPAFRPPSGAVREFRTGLTPDGDKDGVVRWEQKDDVPRYGLWLATDMTDGRIASGEPGGLAPRPQAFPEAMFVRNASGAYAHVVIPLTSQWYATWVRPGVGAWTLLGGDNSAFDHDRTQNGYWFLAVASMTPVGGSPAPPAGVQPGDTFAAIHWGAQRWFGDRVDEHLREADGPGTLQFAAEATPSVRGSEGAGVVRVVVMRTRGSDGEVSVDYATEDGTARAGVHYVAVAGRLTFGPGEIVKTLEVPLVNDAIFSGETRLRLVVSNPAGTTFVDGTSREVVITDDDPAPRLSAEDVKVQEGDEGTREVSWVVSISGATRVPVTASWGYGLENSGWSASGALTFTPGGPASQIVKVRYDANRTPEPNRTYAVSLFNIKNASVETLEGRVTVVDDDVADVDLLDVTVVEGTKAVVLVSLSVRPLKPVTLKYTTVRGSAVEGADFTTTAGTLTFDQRRSRELIEIPIANDALAEGAETFTIILSDPVGARFHRVSATVTILDAAAPVLSGYPETANEGENAVFVFRLSMASAAEVRFRATTAPGTATSAKDFAAKEQTISIAAGKVEAFFTVPLERDSAVEGPETFLVNVSDVVGATLATRVVTATIVDTTSDPNLGNVTVDDVQVIEGNAGATVARFTVSLPQAPTTVVSVGWGTADGSATAASDYVAASGTLTFAPGETRKVIDVAVKGDTEHEVDETFSVALGNGNGGTCRIVNDDAAAPRRRTVRH